VVENGTFREDLYYRLNVIEMTIPPLKERREDVPLLAIHFLEIFNNKHNFKICKIDESAMHELMNHNWPGNVRELSNMIERAVLLCESDTITIDDLPLEKFIQAESAHEVGPLKKSLEHYERRVILDALEKTKWEKEQAAKLLNIDLATLYRKIKKLSIQG
jgi:transcriptional regulator with PAS, ATPase and Fis domain